MIDTFKLRDTLAKMSMPKPGTREHMSYMDWKAKALILSTPGHGYNHTNAVNLYTSLVVAGCNPIWRWSSDSRWHPGNPPSCGPTGGQSDTVRFGVDIGDTPLTLLVPEYVQSQPAVAGEAQAYTDLPPAENPVPEIDTAWLRK